LSGFTVEEWSCLVLLQTTNDTWRLFKDCRIYNINRWHPLIRNISIRQYINSSISKLSVRIIAQNKDLTLEPNKLVQLSVTH
jgi:hypothetical protein